MHRSKRLQIRFFLSLTLISVCCILVLATVLFFWFRDKTITNVSQANEAVLLGTENTFTRYKEIVENYTMDFYGNPNIHALMLSGDNDWSDQLYSVLSQVRGALKVNPYMDGVYIFGRSEPVAIFENNALDPEAKTQLFDRIRESRLQASPFLWETTLNNGQPKTLLTVFYNDRAFDSSVYDGGVAITIDLAKLQKLLFSSSTDGAARYAVLSEAAGVLMQSDLMADTFNEQALLAEITASPDERGSLVWQGSGEKQLISYVHVEDQGFWYVSATPYQDSIRDIAGARNLMTGVSLLLMLAAALGAGLVSRRLYRPLGRLFGDISALAEDSRTGGRSVGLEEAGAELQRIATRMRDLKEENHDSALIRWLVASPESGVDHRPLPPAFAEGLSDGRAFCVAVLSLPDGKDEQGQHEQRASVIRLLEGAFAGVADCKAYRPHNGITVLIVSEETEGGFGDDARFRERWTAYARGTLAEQGITLGVSRQASAWHELKRSYDEAMDSLLYVKLQERASLVFSDDTIHLNNSDVPETAVEPVLTAVRQPERELVGRAVERLLDVACNYRLEPATIALSRLAAELKRMAERAIAEGQPAHADFLDVYQHIWRIRTYPELHAWLVGLAETAQERISSINAMQSRDLADRAIAYVQQHFADPSLALGGLADKLAISPAYLSRLITETVGSSFPDYVNQQRLERAQSLLVSELELDIRTIAEQVGYNSSTYFTTQFKKRYGITPSKWRLNHIHQRSGE
ncbi:helix-turn-helix domain-containing protein [Paenibacillus daejeonensis]|uniref:helix-turn-helix domain-containing protein n=1 Tax=Paenibacillus daejeonensis TaxID=135193 RepID=UPI0003721FF4|nr:helix-turn-helix domain-containing protein [Paenibacillus daejeonensis]